MVSTDAWYDFKRERELTTQEVPYDYASIMHYGEFCASANGQRTILPVRNSTEAVFLGQFQYPTDYDYLHVNLLYCSGECSA